MINHINGNAIYNLRHPLLEVIVQQLEDEAQGVTNAVPYDYRIGQMIEEVQTGVLPDFSFTKIGEKGLELPDTVVSLMMQFDLEHDIRETPLIGDYSSTNMLPSQLKSQEVIVHGANILSSWDAGRLGVSIFNIIGRQVDDLANPSLVL